LIAVTSGGDQGVELVDLHRQLLVAAGQRAQREHRRDSGVPDRGPVGAPRRAVRDQLAVTEPAQRHPQRIGRGHDQRLDLALGIGAGRHRGAAGHPQRAQRVDLPTAGLRDTAGPTGLGSPRGGLGVDRVGLTLPAAGLTVRAVDLDQLHPSRLQKPSQASPINSATFNPDPHQLPKRAQPGQQCGVTGRGGRELPVPQQPAGRVECGGGVGVFVRVDPTGDLDVGLLAGGGGICHRGHVVSPIHPRSGAARTSRASGQDSDGYLLAQAPMRSRRHVQ
jgi:hypothetical protein